MPPVIDKDKCNGCGLCIDACAEDVFFGSKAGEIPTVTYPEECTHYNSCVEVCPVGAIKLRIPPPIMILYK